MNSKDSGLTNSSSSIRVLILGNSGSGKSTLARKLALGYELPHLDLDTIVWEPGLVAVPRAPDAVIASLEAFLQTHSQWVIEGCYGELVEVASGRCTELVFLNPGEAACIANNLRRPWEPHKYASIEEQNSRLDALQAWVAGYYTRSDSWSYQEHRRIFDSHGGAKRELTAGAEE